MESFNLALIFTEQDASWVTVQRICRPLYCVQFCFKRNSLYTLSNYKFPLFPFKIVGEL
jgi:hypothetical protein